VRELEARQGSARGHESASEVTAAPGTSENERR
jgi:hypothetical protein